MQGVQSFVAQRQQGQPTPSRQITGAQHRVSVPTTKLGVTKQEPSYQRRNPNLPAGSPAADASAHTSRQQSAGASTVQNGFDTDVEGFDDTATMSIGGSSRGLQGEVHDHNRIASRYSAEAVNDLISGAQVPFRRGREQPHHFQESSQVDAEGSWEEDEEGSYGESADEEGDEDSEDESVRDGILQDLNSLGFSQYLQEETPHMTDSQPIIASPALRNDLALGDVVQHSQKPANSFPFKANSVDGDPAELGVKSQRANRQGHERAMKQPSAVSVQKVQGISIEHPSVPDQPAAQRRKHWDHHEPSQQPSVTSHQTLQPRSRARVGVAKDIVVTSEQLHANEERRLSVQPGSFDFGDDDDSSVDQDPNIDRRHNGEPSASVDRPQTRKRNRDLDYGRDQLSSMTFQQLSNEPFNLDYDAARASFPQEFSRGSLSAKMDYILGKLKDDDAKLVQRRAFFSSLPIEQYEECANLMIRRFSDILSKYTDARHQRRRVTKDFEAEIAKREACVRCKTTVVDKDLGRLKRGGEEVVRGAAS